MRYVNVQLLSNFDMGVVEMRLFRSSAMRVRLTMLTSLALILATLVAGYGCGSSSGARSGLPGDRVTMDQVARGRAIITQSGCVDCHNHGKNDPSETMWLAGYQSANPNDPGKFSIAGAATYAANITPDNATGIGMHSDRQIYNAITYGLDPEATPDVVITSPTPGQGNFPANPTYLAPPMPWTSIRNMTDADRWAIVAYLKHGIKAVSNTVPASASGPPFSPTTWAPLYAPSAIGVSPVPAYPLSNEQFVQ
jgi:hypothetical protein